MNAEQDSRLTELYEVAYEALSRIAKDEPAGEADLANIARFCCVFLKTLHADGWLKDGDEQKLLNSPIQKSMSAKSGPAMYEDGPIARGPLVIPNKPS